MKRFSDLGIKPPIDQMIGEKIKISKILNCDITVTNFKIEDSKFQKNKTQNELSPLFNNLYFNIIHILSFDSFLIFEY